MYSNPFLDPFYFRVINCQSGGRVEGHQNQKLLSHTKCNQSSSDCFRYSTRVFLLLELDRQLCVNPNFGVKLEGVKVL